MSERPNLQDLQEEDAVLFVVSYTLARLISLCGRRVEIDRDLGKLISALTTTEIDQNDASPQRVVTTAKKVQEILEKYGTPTSPPV